YAHHATHTIDIYTLSLHDALPILSLIEKLVNNLKADISTSNLLRAYILRNLKMFEIFLKNKPANANDGSYSCTEDGITDYSFIRSEEHTSELQSRFDIV